MRPWASAWLVALSVSVASTLIPVSAHAQTRPERADTSLFSDPTASPIAVSPYSDVIRKHFYLQLRKSPVKAFLWELALPGAGHVYAGFYVQAALLAAASVTGACLWVAGAAREHRGLWLGGAITFAGARTVGLVSAPASAAVLNKAFRRQLGIKLQRRRKR